MQQEICRICNNEASFYDSETRGDRLFTILKCNTCKTIQTFQHYDEVSPDYINLKAEEVDDYLIQMNREHKQGAYMQFLNNLRDLKMLDIADCKILDIGCGTAGFGECMEKNGVNYLGFDASNAQVSFAQSRGMNVLCATTLKEYFSLQADQNIDVFTMWDVLEHIRKPHEFLAELKKFMRPNSQLFISIPNGGAHEWKRFLYKLIKGSYSFDAWEHVFYYNPTSIRILLEGAGFEIVKVGSVVCYPRKMNISEFIRRTSFYLTCFWPNKSPQIYAFAKPKI
jgi:2-polyprenyl-3-methyl-5-hydroxy-6-metoxy-1,4-benzoquinol methylase